jgi:predicted Rossmann fold nucleotide-binding protein DprA/Smf involved in DNA uptake
MDNLSLNAQAIMLLSAYFNKGDKPLTIAEYTKFAKWLKDQGKQPGDLLKEKIVDTLQGWEDKKITIERIEKLLARGNAMAIALQKWQNAGIWVLTRADAEYPKRLKKRLGQKAPPLLYGAGNKKILKTRGVAIVGSRNVGNEDLEFSHKLVKKLALCGYSVVSGGARGVDEASMIGSIEAEGTTIGVLADGLLKKVLSKKYRQAIMQGNLVLITPFYPEGRFSVGNAMGRNKYIYTLADAAIVVHSGKKGGTWEGAKENLRHNWVPLFIKESDDPEAGNRELIDMGGASLPRTILKDETIEYLFEVSRKEKKPNENEKIDLLHQKKKEAISELSLDDKILELLSKERLPIKKIAEKLNEEEKVVKKSIDKLVKSGKIQKHRNRPLQFSRILKLPGMDNV